MPEFAKLYRRVHFYAGNCWRIFSKCWLQKNISPEQATSIFACSFGKSGWHHLLKTLEEYDANPAIDYKQTTLYRFLNGFCPTSTSFLADREPPGSLLPLFVYPWGTFKAGESVSHKNPWQSRFCGTSTDAFIEEEFQKTITLYKKIRSEGYSPWKFGNTFVGGTILRRSNGEERFIVLQGNHRMAIMAHLGFEKIAVRNVPGWLKVVREEDLHDWPLVADGTCLPEHAVNIFDAFFVKDGHHVRYLLKDSDSVLGYRKSNDISPHAGTIDAAY